MGGAMLKVEIRPEDVRSVPEYDAEKLRCSRYRVLEVIDAPVEGTVDLNPGLAREDERFHGFVAGLPADSDGRVILDDEDTDDEVEEEYCDECGSTTCVDYDECEAFESVDPVDLGDGDGKPDYGTIDNHQRPTVLPPVQPPAGRPDFFRSK